MIYFALFRKRVRLPSCVYAMDDDNVTHETGSCRVRTFEYNTDNVVRMMSSLQMEQYLEEGESNKVTL